MSRFGLVCLPVEAIFYFLLSRYYETKKRVDYIGDISSGSAKDFRYYHYRRVPYFGGSDNYAYVRKIIQYMNTVDVKY